jgi:hypothetical protein
MTPYQIDVLVHYYARCEDHPDLARNPPAWRIAVREFTEQGLMREGTDGMSYSLTERGTAYVDALQRVPLPVQIWVIQSNVSGCALADPSSTDNQRKCIYDRG